MALDLTQEIKGSSYHYNFKWKTVPSKWPANIYINCHRQIIRKFSNDDGNEKEKVTSK